MLEKRKGYPGMKKKLLSLFLMITIVLSCIVVLPGCEKEEIKPHDGVVLYQLGPDDKMLMMGYVIKTSGNKYIVIDGGGVGKKSSGYLLEALQDITGQEFPEIEAWFLTHLHDDHVTEFCLITDFYNAKYGDIKINNVYFNLPSKEFMNNSEGGKYAYLHDDVRVSFDKVMGKGEFEKINGKNVFEGDIIEIDDVKIEVLMTVTDEEKETNINDTSLILRMTVADQTVLFLADAYLGESSRLVEKYGNNLKSDIVQMAHHGQQGITEEAYKLIDPTLCLWPSPAWVFNNTSGTLKTFNDRQWMMDMGVKYHIVSGLDLTQFLNMPVDFSTLEERDITPPKQNNEE